PWAHRRASRCRASRARAVIASLDGNVYVHWAFHRSRTDACTPYNARPQIILAPGRKNSSMTDRGRPARLLALARGVFRRGAARALSRGEMRRMVAKLVA